jgi:uncharacterized protein YndB with AHSA1/START domain
MRMVRPEDSPLRVRRSIHVAAAPEKVWQAFSTKSRMEAWWGALVEGEGPEAGKSQGQWLDTYEPRLHGRIVMAVMMGDDRAAYGGRIVAFDAAREFTFENDWIPNRGWAAPTFVTIRLQPALGGTLVELFHYGFEHTGGDVAAEHAGYEQGWGMTQLNALKTVVEGSD